MRRLTLVALAAAASLAAPATAAPAQLTRLVPLPDGQANFGFTFRLFDSSDPLWGDTRPFNERMQDSIANELGGKSPNFLTVWTPWQRYADDKMSFVPFSAARDDMSKVRSVVGEQGVIVLDWTIGNNDWLKGALTVHEIARGAADAFIRSYARDVRDYGKPILVKLFASEFNGDWIWSVSPHANSGVTTDDFASAWRRVVDIFHAVGATNASWAWIVNSYAADPAQQPNVDRNIGAYYPGDAYVDWVGVDVYDVGLPNWMDGPYGFALAHGKPVFVGEFAVRHEWSGLPASQWPAWVGSVFDYFESHPAIKAISYFNYCNRFGATHVRWDPARSIYIDGGKVNYVPGINDHDHRLLAGGPELQALFAKRISSPRYVSAIRTEPVESTPQVATAAIGTVSVRRSTAVVRWTGNLAADTYDLAVRRAGAWRIVTGLRATSRRFRGRTREVMRVRIRGETIDGVAGEWSGVRRVVFGR
jgi:Glycosyl hydrolase family 26